MQTTRGHRPSIIIHGNDYDTPDGTCIRDFLHVADLWQAHVLALQRLLQGGVSRCSKLGNGQGRSVLEAIETARAFTGLPIPVLNAPRQPGDLACLIANARRARQELG